MIHLSLGTAAGLHAGLRRAGGEAARAPALVRAPRLIGSGVIGTAVTLDPGTWSGHPAPLLAIRWLRGGVAIPGASGQTYVPRPEDDRTDLVCAVEAVNAAGTTEARTVALQIVQPAPFSTGPIPDIILALNSGVQTLDGSSIFTGASLTFSVIGEGVSVNPATGELTIPTDVLRTGLEVTVTAANSGGEAAQSFRLTIAEPQTPPALVTAPTLAGTGEIGTELTVDAGAWSGTPDPAITLQWLGDGAEIPGAAGADYTPLPEDDGRALTCRVTATNAAGLASAAPAPVRVAYPAPTLLPPLADVTATEGDAAIVVAAADAFAGAGLVFAVEGAGATIDPATGVLTIPTGTVLAEAVVTVTATNSGGRVAAEFRVTIVPAIPAFPPAVADGLWSVVEVRDADPAGRRRIVLDAGIVVPPGFELRFYSGPVEGGEAVLTNRVMAPGETFTTEGTMALGTTCHNALYWLRTADGTWAPGTENGIVFTILGLEPVAPTPLPPVLLGATPVLAGTGKIGSEVTIETGSWGGEPAPAFALQWLRDGAPIEGATAAAYTPVASDDGCALACRVTAANVVGSVTIDTAALSVTYVAPTAVGELFDEIFDQNTGAQPVPTAQVFAGEALVFAVTGAGALIDAATGLVTIDTDVPLSGETITIFAANSGGSVERSFLLTVEAEILEPGFPPMLPTRMWTVTEVRDTAPAGRRRIVLAAAIDVPAGYELRFYSGPVAGGQAVLTNRVMAPGETFTTSGSMPVGATCHNVLFWLRTGDGAWARATENEISFPILGLSDGEPEVPGANALRTSVSQYGATFTFSTARPTGQYANGDWWVQSPVSIVAIDPASAAFGGRQINGAMADHGYGFASSRGGSGRGRPQGADSQPANTAANTIAYDAALNVDPGNTGAPLAYAAGAEASITKWISQVPPGSRSVVRDMAVLTVVASPPPAGAFRPAPCRLDKAALWVSSALDMSVFPDLAPPASMPAPGNVVRWLVRPHQHADLDGTKQNINPSDNAPIAGREYAVAIADAGLLLCTNALSAAAKRALAELMVQQGIDIYERARGEMGCWADDGQLNCGRKLPLVLAALLLNDRGMKDYADGLNTQLYRKSYKFASGRNGPGFGIPVDGPIFMEDRQTFYVRQSQIDQAPTEGINGSTPVPFNQSHLNKPWWGIEAWTWPNKNTAAYPSAYSQQNSAYQMGTALCAHLVPGARAVWNYPAFFDFVDFRRDWMLGATQGDLSPSPFHKDMWRAYRALGGPIYPAA